MKIKLEKNYFTVIALVCLILATGLAMASQNVLRLAPPAAASIPNPGHSSTDVVVNVAGAAPCAGDMSLQDAIDNGCIDGGPSLTCQTFAGPAPVGDLCPNCYLENRNEMVGPDRFMLSNDSASITHRCIELGYDWGYATSSSSWAQWCFFGNARTKRWIGGAVGWQFGACENYTVRSAECCTFN
jgi:hypothetical protein